MVYAYITFTLVGAIIFCGGMLLGIRCYRHAQMPFMDLTPVQSPSVEKHPVEEHPNDDSLDWNAAERYINNLSDLDDDE